MRAASRTHRTHHPWATTAGAHCVTGRRRSADVLGVYESLAEAESAAAILAGRGIADAGIALVLPHTDDVERQRRQRTPGRPIVLLRGDPGDVERAHEILADAAALSHEDCLPARNAQRR